MQKINQVLDEKRHALKMLEDFRKALKASKEQTKYSAELRKYIEENPAIKTVEQCQMKIVKLKKSLESEEIKFKNKEDNKAVALGTSKINYMDPRITIAWCKKREVQIEKIFPKTLRAKFAWAMPTPRNYEF